VSRSRNRVLEVLEPAFSDRTAAERRRRVLEADGRDDLEVGAMFSDLDRVVAAVRDGLVAARARADAIAKGGTAQDLRVVKDRQADPRAATKVAPRVAGADRGDEVVVDDALPRAAAAEGETPPEMLADAPTRPATSRPSRARDSDHARRTAELLYEDVLWLFSVNDGEGALISLERLLMLGRLDGEAREFVELNAEKLLHLYESYIGPFTKVPTRGDVAVDSMPKTYLEIPAIERVFRLVDGKRSLGDIMDTSPLTRIETCAGLEQLNRARVIQI
jgi:hypothetical protein